ncbi:hypothetical protein CI238_00402 [Colletotrichum incanum]|uniref:Uncharacterized protein n=1 Tax=Colletotrichum incanum TaxID=1573173 RepID=A0A161WB52_COLIC|nr:hypothetical protein CI238_00402 [Colletotrichum incanum]
MSMGKVDPEKSGMTLTMLSLIVGSLAAQSPATDEGFKDVFVPLAAIAFIVSMVGFIIMAYDMWPRSGHARVLGGTMGFILPSALVVATPCWPVGIEGDVRRIASALGGFHLGFVLEAVTGCVGRMLKVLEGTREEP